MLKKIIQLAIFFFLILAAALIQASVINVLPSFFGAIDLLLIIVVFTLFFYDFRSAVVTAGLGGFCLDLWTFNFFGFHLLALFLTLLFAAWILNSWLTNRSLYSFLSLIVLSTLVYNVVIGLLSYLSADGFSATFGRSAHFWLYLLYQCLWSGLAGLLLFNLAAAATKRLKPFFLEKA
jgi:cell shape-determining protein MreD